MLKVQVKILDKRLGDTIALPQYATPGSAGLDLRACLLQDLVISPGQTELVATGISIYIANPGYAAIILPRSGLGHKHGLVLGNGTGLIDSDYQGQLYVSCFNRSQQQYTLSIGERFAQLVCLPICQLDMDIVADFTASYRGEDGFGSTGRQQILAKNNEE
jgi:dUTP pyrophosphatase